MGTSSTPQELLSKLRNLDQVAESIAVKSAKANAALAKKNAEDAARKASGGDLKLSNAGKLVRDQTGRVTGRGGAKLSVSVKQRNDKLFLVSAEGPWPLVNNDIPQHEIGPAGLAKEAAIGPVLPGTKRKKASSGRATAKGREGRAKALKTPYGLKRRVFVKRIKGKRVWQKAAADTGAEVASGRTVARIAQQEMQKVFR